MTTVNDFKAFATGVGANVLDQAAYEALTTLLANGFTGGVAEAIKLNKVWRQASVMAHIVGMFMNDYSQDAKDDGDLATLKTNFENALKSIIAANAPQALIYCGTSTGSANAQVLTPSPAIAAYGVGVPGYIFLAGYSNTGALFVNISGVGSVEVRRDSESGLAPLTGGEVRVGSMCLLRYDGTYLRLEDSQLGTAALQNSSLGTPGGTVASVSGAVTAGHLVVFADTAGTIQDGGAAPSYGTAANKAASDNTKSTVSSVSSAATNHIAKFTDNNGTEGDGGVLGALANEGIGAGLEDDGAGNLQVKRSFNAQTGITYTVVNGDRGKIVTLTNAAAVAVTLPQAGSGGNFAAGWFAEFVNKGTTAVTITPTTSTIDGAASVVLGPNQGVIIHSDGTNYCSLRGLGLLKINIQTLTSSGTYTPTPGTRYAIVELVGGGATGGQGGADKGGGGGGGGGYSRRTLTAAQLGASQNVTIGAAGAATPTGAAAPGNAGGTTSFGALLSATGGSPGDALSNGGGYGVGVGGDVNLPGQYGGYGSQGQYGGYGSQITLHNGNGGSSFLGWAGLGGINASFPSSGYGAGSPGASNTNVGTAAMPGVVFVTEFL